LTASQKEVLTNYRNKANAGLRIIAAVLPSDYSTSEWIEAIRPKPVKEERENEKGEKVQSTALVQRFTAKEWEVCDNEIKRLKANYARCSNTVDKMKDIVECHYAINAVIPNDVKTYSEVRHYLGSSFETSFDSSLLEQMETKDWEEAKIAVKKHYATLLSKANLSDSGVTPYYNKLLKERDVAEAALEDFSSKVQDLEHWGGIPRTTKGSPALKVIGYTPRCDLGDLSEEINQTFAINSNFLKEMTSNRKVVTVIKEWPEIVEMAHNCVLDYLWELMKIRSKEDLSKYILIAPQPAFSVIRRCVLPLPDVQHKMLQSSWKGSQEEFESCLAWRQLIQSWNNVFKNKVSYSDKTAIYAAPLIHPPERKPAAKPAAPKTTPSSPPKEEEKKEVVKKVLLKVAAKPAPPLKKEGAKPAPLLSTIVKGSAKPASSPKGKKAVSSDSSILSPLQQIQLKLAELKAMQEENAKMMEYARKFEAELQVDLAKLSSTPSPLGETTVVPAPTSAPKEEYNPFKEGSSKSAEEDAVPATSAPSLPVTPKVVIAFAPAKKPAPKRPKIEEIIDDSEENPFDGLEDEYYEIEETAEEEVSPSTPNPRRERLKAREKARRANLPLMDCPRCHVQTKSLEVHTLKCKTWNRPKDASGIPVKGVARGERYNVPKATVVEIRKKLGMPVSTGEKIDGYKAVPNWALKLFSMYGRSILPHLAGLDTEEKRKQYVSTHKNGKSTGWSDVAKALNQQWNVLKVDNPGVNLSSKGKNEQEVAFFKKFMVIRSKGDRLLKQYPEAANELKIPQMKNVKARPEKPTPKKTGGKQKKEKKVDAKAPAADPPAAVPPGDPMAAQMTMMSSMLKMIFEPMGMMVKMMGEASKAFK
jgi:hypothetical protein